MRDVADATQRSPETSDAPSMSGVLALVGGGEWTDGCHFDADLLEEAASRRVTVLATAAAFERPDLVVEQARRYFEGSGLHATVDAVPVYGRADALDQDLAARVAAAQFIYLASGSAMHLVSVLKRTAVWDAVQTAYHEGAVVAAAGPSAAVLCDAMVDPRGGGFGVGLGLVTQLTLIPLYNRWSAEKSRRTIDLAPSGLALAGIPERTALIRGRDGCWRASGAGEVQLYKDGKMAGLDVLNDN
jgi:cyanophycinase